MSSNSPYASLFIPECLSPLLKKTTQKQVMSDRVLAAI